MTQTTVDYLAYLVVIANAAGLAVVLARSTAELPRGISWAFTVANVLMIAIQPIADVYVSRFAAAFWVASFTGLVVAEFLAYRRNRASKHQDPNPSIS